MTRKDKNRKLELTKLLILKEKQYNKCIIEIKNLKGELEHKINKLEKTKQYINGDIIHIERYLNGYITYKEYLTNQELIYIEKLMDDIDENNI
jgi:hypothetical protein